MPSAKELLARTLRDGTEAGLAFCTKEQVAFFHRIHDTAPWKGWANCPEDKLVDSYELVRRTIQLEATVK